MSAPARGTATTDGSTITFRPGSDFDFLLEGGIREKENLLLRPLNATSGDLADSDGEKRILVQKLDQYEPTIWQDTEIIAPLEEMKNFKVVN